MLARSRALDRIRTQRSRQNKESALESSPDPVDPATNAEESTWLNERRVLVDDALRELPEEQRTALELAYYEGLSHGEISGRLELQVGTVKTRIRLGMDKLRHALSAAGGTA